MSETIRQHLIDPEICIRCYTCEAACPADAITHDDNNVVVDSSKCDFCMNCIAPCPTGSIDEWRVVTKPYTVEEQFGFLELPEQEKLDLKNGSSEGNVEAIDDAMAELLAQAHQGAGGKSKAPETASKPTINMYNLGNPAKAIVQGNFRLTENENDVDVRHIILDMGGQPFPVLEGQSIGIIPPGTDENGKAHLPRLYSVSSPRDGERANFNNLSLTVKREEDGVCSNYVCDLKLGDEVNVTGPFGATFLLPNDPDARLLMICTGTGSAPFRGFTMRRLRENPDVKDSLNLVFGARTPEDLPYFGPLKKIPEKFMKKMFAFSRVKGEEKQYVQDKLLHQKEMVSDLLDDPEGYIYICGLKAMEEGVENALSEIAIESGKNWSEIKDKMRDDGRFHVETY